VSKFNKRLICERIVLDDYLYYCTYLQVTGIGLVVIGRLFGNATAMNISWVYGR